jgi:hypothetical protein
MEFTELFVLYDVLKNPFSERITHHFRALRKNPITEFRLLPFYLLLKYNHEVANGKSSLKVEFLYE